MTTPPLARRVHVAADRERAGLAAAIRAALATYRASADLAALERAYAAGQFDRVASLFDHVTLYADIVAALRRHMTAVADGVMPHGAAHATRLAPVAATFASNAPPVGVERAIAEAATQIVSNVTGGLVTIITLFKRRPATPATAAGATAAAAGLGPKAATSIVNRATANDPPTAQDAGMAAAAATSQINAYADTIAATETISAGNLALLDVWTDTLGADASQYDQVWVTTDDDRTCEVCAAMDGQRAPLGGTFDTDYGRVVGPPLHARCRCSLDLDDRA